MARRIARVLIAALGLPTLALATDIASLEAIPSGEDQDTAEIIRLIKKALDDTYDGRLMRRDAHAKAHGCVKGIFRVEKNLPAALRVGIFQPDQSYRAWLRFSNGSFSPHSDQEGDGRGVAIKLLDVPGSADNPKRSLDFLMINSPVFFSPNVRDYLRFVQSGALTGAFFGPALYFIQRPSQFAIALKIRGQKIGSPLSAQYYSMVPFKLGEGVKKGGQSVFEKFPAVKYSLKPCEGQPAVKMGADTEKDPDYLRKAMSLQLGQQAVCLSFLLQPRSGSSIDDIEDATLMWNEEFIKVATITIQPQDFENDARTGFCEAISFNPNNTPPEHAGIGGMNRLRSSVYKAISEHRHAINDAHELDPSKAWDVLE